MTDVKAENYGVLSDDSFVQARADVGGWAKIADQEYLRQRNRVLGV